MTYIRVIPRDLFNESNLLKCYAKLYLNIETLNLPDVSIEHTRNEFEVAQNPDDGSIYIVNVDLVVRGEVVMMSRPLNSREAWPLYVDSAKGRDEIAVFNDDGRFSSDMLDFLRGEGIHAP